MAGADRLLVTQRDAAALLGITPQEFARIRSTGWLPAPIRLGRQVRWRPVELRLWAARDYPPRRAWEANEYGEAHWEPLGGRSYPPRNEVRGEGPPWLMPKVFGGRRPGNAYLVWSRTKWNVR